MGIQHVFSNAVPDGTNTQIVRPSDWNSAHAYTLQDAVSLAGNTAGVLANVSSGTLILAGGNNITVSQNGNSVTISGANAAPAPVGFSAGASSDNLGAVVFSNSNGVSFGLAGSTITATVATNYQAPGAYLTTAGLSADSSKYAFTGFTTTTIAGLSVAGTHDTGGLKLAVPAYLTTAQPVGNYLTTAGLSQDSSKYAFTGFTTTTVAGAVVAGTLDTTGLKLAVPAYLTTAQAPGAYLTTAGLSQDSSKYAGVGETVGTTAGSDLALAVDTNGVSIGYPKWLTTAGLSADSSKYAGTGFTTATTAGTNLVGTLNTAGISMGVPAWLTAAAGGNNLTVQDSATTLQITKLVFANSNNITFGLSTAASLATVTASMAAQTNQTVGIYATGNTTNSSSTTFDARTLGTWNALGALTAGFSNGSIQLSAPATSSIVGTSGISISSNGSTISVYPVARTRLIYPDGNLTGVSAPTNASQTFRYLPVFDGMTGTRIDALISMSAGSAATSNTAALAFSVYAAIYTRNGASLSSLSSGSTQTTYTYASNSAGQTQLISAAIRPMSVPVNFNMTPGEYYIGFNMLTSASSIGANTTNLGLTMSMMGGNQIQTAANYAEITAATATSIGLFSGMGIYSVASTGLLAAVSLSAINQTGSALSAANIALVFRNA